MADDQNPELPLTPPPGGGDGPGALNIQPVNIEEEMKRSYLDYSMSVIIGRALPDVRDGLKPVHRRILYTMAQMGLQPNKATRKCARIVGVVMATKIPPHTLTEIVDATITLVNNPNAQLAEILKFVQGPDFPTAGIIHGRAGVFEAYRTGRGRFMMRAKAKIETFSKDREAIIVTEIPYQVNKAKLVERIAQLVNGKDIEDISDIRDESDRDGMRIVVELKRGAEPQIVLNQLFKHTQMQESFSMILLAVVNGQPREMG